MLKTLRALVVLFVAAVLTISPARAYVGSNWVDSFIVYMGYDYANNNIWYEACSTYNGQPTIVGATLNDSTVSLQEEVGDPWPTYGFDMAGPLLANSDGSMNCASAIQSGDPDTTQIWDLRLYNTWSNGDMQVVEVQSSEDGMGSPCGMPQVMPPSC